MAARHPRVKHSDAMVHYPTPNGFAHRPPKLDKHKSSEVDLPKWPWKMTPHIALEWDARQEKVVSKKSQVGLSWHHLPPGMQKTCNISSSPSSLADVIGVPSELFELNDLRDVLSAEVWNTCLSDSERQVLHKFLPTGIDHESALLPLLSGDNFHFGNPLTSWGASVCKGECHPDVVSRRDLDLKELHNGYCSDVQSYHGKMLNKLKGLKELCSSCKNSEEEFPLKLESWRKNQHSKKVGMCSVDALKGGSIRAFNETQGPKSQSKLNEDISSRQRSKKRKIESLQDAPEKTCMVSAGANGDSQAENFTIKVTKQQYADIILRKRAGKDLCIETLKTIMKEGKQNSGNVRQKDSIRVREHWSKIVQQDLPIAYSKFASKIAETKSLAKTVAEQCKQRVVESMDKKVSEVTASSPQDSTESYEVEDNAKQVSSDSSLTRTEFPPGVTKTLDSSLVVNFPKLEVDTNDDFPPPSDAEGDPERGDSIVSHSKRSEKHSDSASEDDGLAIRSSWSGKKGGVVPETKDGGPFFTGRTSDIWDARSGSVSNNNNVGSSTQSCIVVGEEGIENSVPQRAPFFDRGGGGEEMYSTTANIGLAHNNNNNSLLLSHQQREGGGLHQKGDQGSEGSSDAFHQQFANTHQSPGSVDSLRFCSSSNLSRRRAHSSEGVGGGHPFQQMQQDGQQKLPPESSSSARLFSPSHTLATLDEPHVPRMPLVADSDMVNPLDKYGSSAKELCAGTESSPIMGHQHQQVRLEQEMMGQSSYPFYQHLPPPPSHSAQDLFSCSSVAPSILPGWPSPQTGNLGSSSALGFTPHSGQWNGDAMCPNWPDMDAIPGSKEGKLRVPSSTYSNLGGQAQSPDLSMLDCDSRKPNSCYNNTTSRAVSTNLYPCQQQGEGEGEGEVEGEQPQQQAFQCSRELPQNSLISCNDKDGLIYRGGRGGGGKGSSHSNIPYVMNQLVSTQAGGEQVSGRGQQDVIPSYHRFSKTNSHLGIRYNQ